MAGRHQLRSLAATRAALARRADVREAVAAARREGIAFRLVGGAVRDAFLGREGGDLDVAVEGSAASRFAEALAARLGLRAIPMGRPGTRVFRIPAPPGEIDVWEVAGSAEDDRDRRDFTVNALAFALPGWHFDEPAGARDDLAHGRLRLPRPGVLLEDPLRVLRAARFCAELPGFRVAPQALAEMRAAAPLLARTAPERRLAEWDRILAAPGALAARGLSDLERWGALAPLLPASTAAERHEGIRRVRRLPRRPDPGVARVALVLPLGNPRALRALEEWKAPKRDLRIADRVLGLAIPSGPLDRAAVTRAARALDPFVREGAALLSAAPSAVTRRLGGRLAGLSDRALERALRPPRFLEAGEVAALLGIPPGPELGRALARLDAAVAEGRVRSAAGARGFLAARGATER